MTTDLTHTDSGVVPSPYAAPLTPSTDAEWCGYLAERMREAIAELEGGSRVRCVAVLSGTIELYEKRSGFPPPDAKLLGTVSGVTALRPGERAINGFVYYSDAWLDGPREVQ